MAGIKCPKNGHACINFACQNGSAVNCQWQQIATDANTTLRPESQLNKKTRESGYYWIMAPGADYFEPAEWSLNAGCWELIGNPILLNDGELTEIDERRIVREEPIKAND